MRIQRAILTAYPNRSNDMGTRRTHDLDKQFVASVAKAIQILSCFRQHEPLLGTQDLATRCAMPKSTISRFTYTLTKLDCLELDTRYEKYRLGARIASLGHAMIAGYDIAERIRPFMQALATEGNCLVTLGAYEDHAIICLASARGPASRAPHVEPGMRVSAFSTGMGRAYLASCGRLERERILGQAIARRPEQAAELESSIARAVAEYGRRGYCTTIEGWRKGQNGMAVPLYLKRSGRRLMLGCGGPSREVTPEDVVGELATRMLSIANDVEVLFERSTGAIRRRPGPAPRSSRIAELRSRRGGGAT